MNVSAPPIDIVRVGPTSVPLAIGAFVPLVGLVIIGEWTFGYRLVARLSPTDSSMKFNTSCVFTLFGAALALLQTERRWAHRTAYAMTAAGLSIAALTLSQYVTGVDLGLDELVMRDHPNPDITSSPGRMSPLVAFNFLLSGGALLLWRRTARDNTRPADLFAILGFVIPVVAALGYLFSAIALYSFATVTGVALVTAVLFLILHVGLLGVCGERSLTKIFLSKTRGGFVLRFLFPTSLGAIILLDWLSMRAARAGLFSESLVVPLGTLASGTVITLLIWRSAKLLYDSEQKEKETFEQMQRAYQTAEEANRMKDEFISIVSHELRTPLNSILGWLKIIRENPTDANIRRGLEVIARQSGSQLQLIEDLLDTSRILSGKMRLEIAPVAIETVLAEAIETVRPAAEAKNIRLLCDAAAASLITGDRDRLLQVFWNLLSNAVKFTPEGGEVRVSVEAADGRLVVRIADTGEGIAADFLPNVFDRFRQSSSSTTRRAGGLGLGLSLVRQIVELHGGQVTAESDGAGRGATFTVRLPFKGGE